MKDMAISDHEGHGLIPIIYLFVISSVPAAVSLTSLMAMFFTIADGHDMPWNEAVPHHADMGGWHTMFHGLHRPRAIDYEAEPAMNRSHRSDRKW